MYDPKTASKPIFFFFFEFFKVLHCLQYIFHSFDTKTTFFNVVIK